MEKATSQNHLPQNSLAFDSKIQWIVTALTLSACSGAVWIISSGTPPVSHHLLKEIAPSTMRLDFLGSAVIGWAGVLVSFARMARSTSPTGRWAWLGIGILFSALPWFIGEALVWRSWKTGAIAMEAFGTFARRAHAIEWFHYLLTTRLLGPLSSAWIWGSVAFIFGWALREKERPLSFLPLFLALPWIGLGAWIGSRWASVGLFLIGAALFLAASWRGAFRASLNQSTASLHFGVAIASMGALLALSSSIGPAFVQSAFFGAPSASSSETLAFLTSRLRDEGTIPKILMWTSPILGIASSALLLGPAFKASPPSSRFVGGLIFIATGFLITAFGSAGNLMGQAYALKYLSAYAIGTIELPTLPIPNESSELDLLVRENQVHLPKGVSASIGKDEQALKTKLESLIGQREEEPGLPPWLHNSSPEQAQRENAGTTQVGIKKLERLTVAIDRRTQASFLRDFIRASRQAGFTVLCIGASPEAPSSAGREVLMEWAPPLAWFAPPFGCIEAYLPEAFESVSHDHWHGTIGKEATLLLRKESSQAQQQIDAMQVETLFGPESIKIDQDVSNVNALTEIAQLKIGAEASLQSMLQLISKLRGIGIRPVLTGE